MYYEVCIRSPTENKVIECTHTEAKKIINNLNEKNVVKQECIGNTITIILKEETK